MNLIEVFQKEVNDLQITDKEIIKNYIYRRTGEVFNYNPLWSYGNAMDKINIRNTKVNPEDVQDFNIVCFGWADYYTALLHSFDIDAKIVGDNSHKYVVVKIDNKLFVDDLTKDGEDFFRIKYGFELYDTFAYIDKQADLKFIKRLKNEPYRQVNITMEEVLMKLKCELLEFKLKYSFEDYLNEVFKVIANIINFPRPNIGFICEVLFIKKLLKIFINSEFTPAKLTYFNHEEDKYVAIYLIKKADKSIYFACKKNEAGFYEFKEINQEEVDFYEKNYYSPRLFKLKHFKK